jgi:hypothetical protein
MRRIHSDLADSAKLCDHCRLMTGSVSKCVQLAFASMREKKQYLFLESLLVLINRDREASNWRGSDVVEFVAVKHGLRP